MTAQGMNKILKGILQYRLKFKDQMLQQFQQVIKQTSKHFEFRKNK